MSEGDRLVAPSNSSNLPQTDRSYFASLMERIGVKTRGRIKNRLAKKVARFCAVIHELQQVFLYSGPSIFQSMS